MKLAAKNFLLTMLLVIAPCSMAAEDVSFLYTDHLGSVIAATDSSGVIKWRELYTPYGERFEQIGVNPEESSTWYTGAVQDAESGLVYLGARYYNPVVGRFYGVDSIEFNERAPETFNRYAYAKNNPFLYIDPDGAQAITAFVPPIHFSSEHGPIDLDRNNARSIVYQYVFFAFWITGGSADLFPDPNAGDAIESTGSPLDGFAFFLRNLITKGATRFASGADNVATAPLLRDQLKLEAAASRFDAAGVLGQDTIRNSRKLIDAADIGNPAIPKGFSKYTTETIETPFGGFKVHFYMNKAGELFLERDYKAVLNSMSGVK